MAAGGHFEKKSKKKLCIDLKWREMRAKVIFVHIQNGPNRTSKMNTGGHFGKKYKKKVAY